MTVLACYIRPSGSSRLGRRLDCRPRLECLEDRTAPATLVVGSAADSGPGSLREAIAVAVADDVITFAPALTGQTIGLSSRLVIDKSLTIDGPGAGALSISGGSSVGLIAIAGSPRVSIDGLTLTGGVDQNAGAIDNPGGSLFLRDCVVSNNRATGAGGAILSGGRLSIDGCTFSSNAVTFGSGGAIQTTGEAVITTSVFMGNTALSLGLPSNGGAINNQGGSLSLVGCTFASNSVSNGSVPAGQGGGLYNSGDASVTNCTFTDNQASGTFFGGTGGAIANQGGNLLVRNSTISGNTASGGPVASTPRGGGIANVSGTLTLLNSIVAGNSAASGPDLSGEVTSLGNNLIQSLGGANVTGDVASNVVGMDPRLEPLAQNGGPTPTFALMPDSPAINAGRFTGTPPVDQRGFPRVVGGRMDIGAYEFGSTAGVGISLAVGSGAGAAVVNVYGPSGSLQTTLTPFVGFAGGVTTAVADVNGDGTPDVIVGAGPGAPGGHVKVFDSMTGGLLLSFFAYPGFLGGVSVGSGDFDGDGLPDVIVGAGPGAPGGHVKSFSGLTGGELMSFFAFEGFIGGVSVAGGDVNGDGIADVIVGAGPGAPGGHVKVFSVAGGQQLQSFFAFEGFDGGISVGAGDVNGDGFADVIVGAGAGAAGGHVKVFDGRSGQQRESFLSFPGFGGGVRVAGYDGDNDGLADVAVGTGPGAVGGHVKGFDGLTLAALDSFFAFDGFAGGVFLGGG